MPNWTPGPFSIRFHSGVWFIGSSEGDIARCNRKEDAERFAAAPDLYATLEELLASCERDFIIRFGSIRDHISDDLKDAARAALLKANPNRQEPT